MSKIHDDNIANYLKENELPSNVKIMPQRKEPANSEQQEQPEEKYKLICAEDIEEKKLEWLYYPYFPKGKLCTVIGAQGGGKTFFLLALAAAVAGGKPLPAEELNPDYNPFTKEQGKGIYFTSEDALHDTIKPRLNMMGANCKNIFLMGTTEVQLTLFDPFIEEQIKELQPKLIIFDPIQAYLSCETDMNRANEIRPVMSRLIHLADKYGVTIIFVQHMNKQITQNAFYRSIGSNDLTAAPRAAVQLGKDPENDKIKVLAMLKTNLVREEHHKSITFTINSETGIEWGELTDLQADDIVGVRKSKNKENDGSDRETPKRNFAEEWLEKYLEDNNGYALQNQIIKDAKTVDIPQSTLYRAKDKMKFIKMTPRGGKRHNSVYWYFEDNLPILQGELDDL